ncbi:MAG TPA: acetate--CoA ligase family protein [Thermodesulfobacteriota bacterium]|nr:acetate--CoA ligase family protein [Thermodesulfobacteriota bacterium]
MESPNLDIQNLFEPKTLAVIGAARDENKIGYKILKNILTGGYKGKIFPVNPQGGEILGLKAYRSVEEVNETVDVASIVIPAKFVYEAVQSCARKKVKYLTIISSGFSEIGNNEEERRIVSYARAHNMRVLGPNIFGVYSAAASLNATFGSSGISPGRVAIITQSGALGIAMIGKTAVENIGLSAIVSVGNKTDVDEADLLEYLVTDPHTKIVLMYIEGVRDGERLIQAVKKTTRKIPVVVIKSGRSERGAIAAASHTGSLAGSDEIFDAIMRQCGVLRAENVEEAFNWCKFLANTPSPAGESTVIVTNGGGIGVMATDACEKFGVRLYDDTLTLKEIFSTVTPEFGSTKNPVDLTGGATSTHYNSALEEALKSAQIDSVIALYGETAIFDAENLSSMIVENTQRYKEKKKPLVFSIFGGEKIESCLLSMKKGEAAVYGDVYQAVSCLGSIYRYYHYLREYSEAVDEAAIDPPTINRVIDQALKEGRSFLLAHEGQAVMRAAGIPIPQTRIARSLEEAVRAAEAIRFPVVMKVVSRDILHKSDAGGVALDLEDKEEVIDAYQAILRNVRAYKADANIEGVEVSEMVEKGMETIIGARRDRTFGPLIMFGLGGIYVEVMKDVAFRALPINRKEIMAMVKEIRAYPLLLGVRGEEKKDLDSVVDTIIKVGTVLQRCERITDIEINPLMAYEQGRGVKAVDVRILLTSGRKGV